MLCKCSGKYIDIYFILKITCFQSVLQLSQMCVTLVIVSSILIKVTLLTSTRNICFCHHQFVDACVCVYLSVSRITQKFLKAFRQNFLEGSGVVLGTIC